MIAGVTPLGQYFNYLDTSSLLQGQSYKRVIRIPNEWGGGGDLFIVTCDGNVSCTFSGDMIRGVVLVGCFNLKSPLLELFWHLDLRGLIQSEIC